MKYFIYFMFLTLSVGYVINNRIERIDSVSDVSSPPMDIINHGPYGPFGQRSIVHGSEKWYGGGFESIFLPVELPALILYNITDKIKETSRINFTKNTAVSSSGFSPNPNRKFGAISTGKMNNSNIIYKIEVYSYDDLGVYNQTPHSVNMLDIIPDLYDSGIAYNGLSGISNDGKYIVITYGVGDHLDEQRIGILDSQTLELMDSTPTSPGTGTLVMFQQYCKMINKNTHYDIICSDNGYNKTTFRTEYSQVGYYKFDGSIAYIDSSRAPNYIESSDVFGDLVVTGGIYASPDDMFRKPLDVKDSSYNLRFYRLRNGIHYIGGLNLGMDINGVRLSEYKLALSSSPRSYNYILDGNLKYSPSTLAVYDYLKIGSLVTLSQQGMYGISPVSYGLAFDGNRLAVSGMPFKYNTTGIRNTALFKV